MKKFVLVTLVVGILAAPLALAAPASASIYVRCTLGGRTLRLQSARTVWVDARHRGVPVADVRPGQAVSLYYNSGTMWSGVWFTGENGPEGWPGWIAPHNGQWAAPGADQYSLVSQFMPWGRHQGLERPRLHLPRLRASVRPGAHLERVELAVKDQRYDDNTGGFWVDIFIWE